MKLSVAIPTYNGAKYIREALDSIIFQLDDIDEGIEIVISDNASTDQTPQIIKEYQNKYFFIKYFRNDKNLGADRNFDLAIRRSKGEYVWLFGDDDKLESGAIKKVLEVLKKYPKVGFIFVNCSSYNEDFSICTKERILELMKDMYCNSADEFYINTKIVSMVVSSNIVKRNFWNYINKNKFIGTNWIHFCVVTSYLNGCSAYCIANPYVILRQGTAVRWVDNGRILIYGNKLSSIIKSLVKMGYERSTVKGMLDSIKINLWKTIIGAKMADLNLSFSLLKITIKNFGNYPSFWLIDFPLLLLPNIFYKILHRFMPQVRRVKQIFSKISNKSII